MKHPTVRAATCVAIAASALAVPAVAGTATVNEVEPNNTPNEATFNFSTYIGWGAFAKVNVRGILATTGDVDYFYVRNQPSSLTVGLTVPAGHDYDLQLVDWQGRLLAANHQGPGKSETVKWSRSSTPAAQYPLSVRVLSVDGTSSPTATYTVRPQS